MKNLLSPYEVVLLFIQMIKCNLTYAVIKNQTASDMFRKDNKIYMQI